VTLSVTGVPHFVLNLPPSMLLTVTSTTGSPDPVAEGAYLGLVRIHADGSRHKVLTGPNPRISGGAWTGVDCHLPYNQPVTYEVTAGPTVVSTPMWLPCNDTWLVHGSSPELSVRVEFVTVIADRGYKSRAERFQPLDAPAVFVSDSSRGGVTGSIEIAVPTADVPPILALLDDDSVILISTPGSVDWDLKWLWCQPGQVSAKTIQGTKKSGWRFITLPFEESADPDTDSAALTCGEAATFAADCGAYAVLYANCGAASIDLRL
jgi:hypothetical protein